MFDGRFPGSRVFALPPTFPGPGGPSGLFRLGRRHPAYSCEGSSGMGQIKRPHRIPFYPFLGHRRRGV